MGASRLEAPPVQIRGLLGANAYAQTQVQFSVWMSSINANPVARAAFYKGDQPIQVLARDFVEEGLRCGRLG